MENDELYLTGGTSDERAYRKLRAYLIHIRFINWPTYISARFEEKREWLVYADNYDDAVLKLDAHIRQGLKDDTHLLVEYVNVTL